jgi:hypothetical protein
MLQLILDLPKTSAIVLFERFNQLICPLRNHVNLLSVFKGLAIHYCSCSMTAWTMNLLLYPFSGSELQLIQLLRTNELAISCDYTIYLVVKRLYSHLDHVLLHDRTDASLC